MTAMAIRKVSISTGFARKVSLNFQSWDFSCLLTEECEVSSDEEIGKIRRKLSLRTRASVYNDILNDMDRIVASLPERPDFLAQAEALKKEASDTLDFVVKELKETEA